MREVSVSMSPWSPLKNEAKVREREAKGPVTSGAGYDSRYTGGEEERADQAAATCAHRRPSRTTSGRDADGLARTSRKSRSRRRRAPPSAASPSINPPARTRTSCPAMQPTRCACSPSRTENRRTTLGLVDRYSDLYCFSRLALLVRQCYPVLLQRLAVVSAILVEC
jgi:hypothetical protein